MSLEVIILAAGKGKRMHLLIKAFPFFLTKAIGLHVHINIKNGDGGAEHLAIFTEDAATLCSKGDKSPVEAVAHTAPVISLETLYVDCSPEYEQA